MTNFVHRIKSRLFLPAKKKALHILDGEYQSISYGRGTDFEDLREYSHGDDIKDIDWKASARHSETLVKRFAVTKRHPVIFVVDTGLNFDALASDGEPKIDHAVEAMGVLGYLAVRHSDSVGAIYGSEGNTRITSIKASEGHLERVLQEVYADAKNVTGSSNLGELLSYTEHTVRQRAIVVVVSDGFGHLGDEVSVAIKRLKQKHDVLWLTVSDINPLDNPYESGTAFHDVADLYDIPDFILADASVASAFSASEHERSESVRRDLAKLAVPLCELANKDDVVEDLIVLLDRGGRKRG